MAYPGAHIVDIRRPKHRQSLLHHLVSYLHKQPDLQGYEQDYNNAFSGGRMIQPFGNARHAGKGLSKPSCPHCGSTFFVVWTEIKYGIESVPWYVAKFAPI